MMLDNTVKIKGYMITNLVTNYVFNEKFTINVRLDNALDKDYALAYTGIPIPVDLFTRHQAEAFLQT